MIKLQLKFVVLDMTLMLDTKLKSNEYKKNKKITNNNTIAATAKSHWNVIVVRVLSLDTHKEKQMFITSNMCVDCQNQWIR